MAVRTAGSTGSAVVQVAVSASGAPGRCSVDGRHYLVAEVHAHWVSGSPWWVTGEDIDTHTWRVTLVRRGTAPTAAAAGRIVDLRCSGDRWRLDRIRAER